MLDACGRPGTVGPAKKTKEGWSDRSTPVLTGPRIFQMTAHWDLTQHAVSNPSCQPPRPLSCTGPCVDHKAGCGCTWHTHVSQTWMPGPRQGIVSRCGPRIWASHQKAAYLNKDCKYSKSPEVQRRLPRAGKQMSVEQTLIYGSRRGRKPCFEVLHWYMWSKVFCSFRISNSFVHGIKIRDLHSRRSRILDWVWSLFSIPPRPCPPFHTIS